MLLEVALGEGGREDVVGIEVLRSSSGQTCSLGFSCFSHVGKSLLYPSLSPTQLIAQNILLLWNLSHNEDFFFFF